MTLIATAFWNLVGLLLLLGAIAFFVGLLGKQAAPARNLEDASGDRRPSLQTIASSQSAATPTPLEPEEPLDERSPYSPPTASSKAAEIDLPNLPLATSLTVSQVAHPTAAPLEAVDDLIPTQGEIFVETEEKGDAHPFNVLEEISHLTEAGELEKLAHLKQYLEHPDSLKRLAAVVALDQMAHESQGQGLLEMISLLNRFTQDVDSQVRLQAATALGTLKGVASS